MMIKTQSMMAQAVLAWTWATGACLGAVVPNYTTSEAGNPFVDGWYADPAAAYYNGTYWVFPTSSSPYDEQTGFDAFSSPDLVSWTKHPGVLTTANVSWATRALWAPATVFRNGKYYLYFAANDLQEDDDVATTVGGIGVAVAATPAGPYADALGRPLIGAYHNGAQPIDPAVFVDDDGQAYVYYGGHAHCNVAPLNRDMTSLGTFPGGARFREITPPGYVEAPLLLKRGATYHLQWSAGARDRPDRAVHSAAARSPLGPFADPVPVLRPDAAVATVGGSGAVVRVPATDIWYVLYHRRPLSETDANHRVLAYDRLYFDDDGAVAPVAMLVHDNFGDGRLPGWTTYGGAFGVLDGQLSAQPGVSRDGGLALLDTNFSGLVLDADVAVAAGTGHAGLAFWAANDTVAGVAGDPFRWHGYYAALCPHNGTVLVAAAGLNGTATTLGEAAVAGLALRSTHHVQVRADPAGEISVFLDHAAHPVLTVPQVAGHSAFGKDGLFFHQASAWYDNFAVAHLARAG